MVAECEWCWKLLMYNALDRKKYRRRKIAEWRWQFLVWECVCVVVPNACVCVISCCVNYTIQVGSALSNNAHWSVLATRTKRHDWRWRRKSWRNEKMMENSHQTKAKSDVFDILIPPQQSFMPSWWHIFHFSIFFYVKLYRPMVRSSRYRYLLDAARWKFNSIFSFWSYFVSGVQRKWLWCFSIFLSPTPNSVHLFTSFTRRYKMEKFYFVVCDAVYYLFIHSTVKRTDRKFWTSSPSSPRIFTLSRSFSNCRPNVHALMLLLTLLHFVLYDFFFSIEFIFRNTIQFWQRQSRQTYKEVGEKRK